IEETRLVVAAHVQQRELPRLDQRYRREFRDAPELPLVWLRIFETRAPDNLHRAIQPGDALRQPHHAVAPLADLTEKPVLGNWGRRWIVPHHAPKTGKPCPRRWKTWAAPRSLLQPL